MAITAQSIVLDVQTTLQDLTGTRWPASELVRFLNDGQRAIVTKRPDSKATTATHTCVAGAIQVIPATAQSLINVHTNAANQAVTKVDRNLMDATMRGWTTSTAGAPVHFMHSLVEPRVFYVYPPATVGTTLGCVFSNYPTDVGAPTAPGKLASTVSGNIDVPDEYEAALLHFVLYRAYSREGEASQALPLAQQNYALFNSLLAEGGRNAPTS